MAYVLKIYDRNANLDVQVKGRYRDAVRLLGHWVDSRGLEIGTYTTLMDGVEIWHMTDNSFASVRPRSW
jgi:hypothetical protein